MIGLKRGTVELVSHQSEWSKEAEEIVRKLKFILGDVAVDIQHIGSTAISSIHAKPILDIVIGVRKLNDIQPFIEVLRSNGIVFRGEDVPGQVLFVKGDFNKDTRTHHIHVVQWNGDQWNNYLNFRDFLNEFPEKAQIYDACKQRLAAQFSNDRASYTAGKNIMVKALLEEAKEWRTKQTARDRNKQIGGHKA